MICAVYTSWACDHLPVCRDFTGGGEAAVTHGCCSAGPWEDSAAKVIACHVPVLEDRTPGLWERHRKDHG